MTDQEIQTLIRMNNVLSYIVGICSVYIDLHGDEDVKKWLNKAVECAIYTQEPIPPFRRK